MCEKKILDNLKREELNLKMKKIIEFLPKIFENLSNEDILELETLSANLIYKIK